MRNFFLTRLAVAVAGWALISMPAGAAELSKTKAEDPVRVCQSGCKVHQDSLAYETCMLKCQDDHKASKPAISTVPARKK
jgi:hypothetical protein